MNKITLQPDYKYDFDLIAIVSAFKDYRLCWNFNRTFNFDFSRLDDIEINLKKKKKIVYFSIYQYKETQNNRIFYLIANKFSGEYLIPELKEVDFFIMLKGNISKEEKINIMKILKSLSMIQTVFEVNPNNLRAKQNLIFDDTNI